MKKTAIISSLLLLFLISIGNSQPRFEPNLNQGFRFQDTQVNETSSLELTVMGNGNPWNIRMSVDNDAFDVNPANRNVGAREAFVFELQFTPEEVENYRARLTIVAMGADGRGIMFSANMEGTGVGGDPEIEINPDRMSFVIDRENDQDQATIRISNVGDGLLEAELEIEDIDWVEIVDMERVYEIEADESVEVQLTTTEDIPENGEHQGILMISSNDPENDRLEVPLLLTVDLAEIGLQEIEMRQGWNMISANRIFGEDFVDDEGPDMELILEDIIDQIILVKDRQGRFCSPEFDYWGIPFWGEDQGYLVKTTEEFTFEILGELIPWDREINLNMGWNMVAYYPEYSFDHLGDALQDLIDRDLLILAKDGFGRFVAPEYGFWGVYVRPGMGILMKVTENCSFSWAPEIEEEVAFAQEPHRTDLEFFPDPQITDVSMSVLINQTDDLVFHDGGELACLTPGGLVAGVALIPNDDEPIAMAVWGDDVLTDEIDGFLEFERLNFFYWRPGWEFARPLHIVDIDGQAIWELNSFIYVSFILDVKDDDPCPPVGFELTTIFPNPFNGSFRVDYNLDKHGKVTVELLGIDGRTLTILESQDKSPGFYQMGFNLYDLADGVYFVRISLGGQQQLKKIVLVK